MARSGQRGRERETWGMGCSGCQIREHVKTLFSLPTWVLCEHAKQERRDSCDQGLRQQGMAM